jgi:Uma2 family endonuclease
MATDALTSETFPPPGWDSDTLKFYEVVDGKILEKPPMGAKGSILTSSLLIRIGLIARSNRLGRAVAETLFLMDRTGKLKRRPDLAFVSDQRWPLNRPVPDTETWDVIPDLAVEFVSESNSANSIMIKIEEYFQVGVRVVWVIYPVVSKVYVYNSPTRVRVLQLGDELDGQDMIPGFRVALSTLFKEGEEEPEPAKPIEGQP